MSASRPLEHAFAAMIAREFVEAIRDSCEFVEIAGSLRRRKTMVNDIDIVAIPKVSTTEFTTADLFGPLTPVNLLERHLATLCLQGLLLMDTNGPKIKRFYKNVPGVNVPIDIYIADPCTWWTLMLIRTGSREHNIALARRAMELHMHLKADGSGIVSPSGELIPIDSEEEVFGHLGLPFIPPEERG